MAIKHHAAHAAPQKTCRACGAKVHVRSKNCNQCNQPFSPVQHKPLTVDETVDTVLKALDLIKRLGEAEAIRLIKKVARETV